MHEVIGLHAPCLHFDANSASAKFASVCNRHLHGNRHNGGMTAEQQERDRLQAALLDFWEANQKVGLKSVRQWAIASGLSPSTINPVLKGTANKRLEDETYFKLAVGASKLLLREVTVDELQGEMSIEGSPQLNGRLRRALAALKRIPADRLDEEIAALEARANLIEETRKPPPQDA
ncbi:hypothetical protein ACJ41P_10375 [Azospirillum argentinense]|uniref:XRE family transcriptional regulator n=1 Tax=Azospirillum argentinense TaxID=2970906 RepID=A0ABW8V5Q7_9PROT